MENECSDIDGGETTKLTENLLLLQFSHHKTYTNLAGIETEMASLMNIEWTIPERTAYMISIHILISEKTIRVRISFGEWLSFLCMSWFYKFLYWVQGDCFNSSMTLQFQLQPL